MTSHRHYGHKTKRTDETRTEKNEMKNTTRHHETRNKPPGETKEYGLLDETRNATGNDEPDKSKHRGTMNKTGNRTD